MKRRTRLFITITGVIALTLARFTGIASADPNETNCTFSGTATLHDGFPATNGNGSFTGTIDCTGTLSISGALTATFTYNEPAATCPAQGDANTTGAADQQFEIDTNGDGTVDYTGEFEWNRVGATAAIVISDVNGPGATGASGAASAAFEPTETPDMIAARCLDPGGAGTAPLTAAVDGAAVIVDAD